MVIHTSNVFAVVSAANPIPNTQEADKRIKEFAEKAAQTWREAIEQGIV